MSNIKLESQWIHLCPLVLNLLDFTLQIFWLKLKYLWFDEAILLNQDGTVSEGSGENLFMIQNDKLITPAETDNVLLGITRDSAIELATKEIG